jgi:hypothetical protein
MTLEEASWGISLSPAVRYGVDVADDLGAGNRDNLGLAPGMERTREVALEPVGISGIRPRREGVRGATGVVGMTGGATSTPRRSAYNGYRPNDYWSRDHGKLDEAMQ